MYDQLGSLYSDQPDYSDPKIADKYLTYEYFLDELKKSGKSWASITST